MLTGDLGQSVRSLQPVTSVLGERLPVTGLLAIGATLLTIVVAVPLGILAAVRKRKFADRALLVTSALSLAVPSFFLGILLLIAFAVNLRWFPVYGYKQLGEGVWPSIQGIALPVVALAVPQTAVVARMTRASMLEVLSQDYVVTARATGLSRLRVYYRHALKNALIPIVTVVGLNFGALLGGTVIIEQVFNFPGLGTLLINSVNARDYSIIQGIVLLFGAAYIVINLSVDIVYAYLDPRVRYGQS
ncbi:MAG: ABC transporter permease subunit [Propionibacteriales bacterium]|nr:ABC transporter permease subunit [Propionibacteriales bacterium]